jgi:hypothetical protein
MISKDILLRRAFPRYCNSECDCRLVKESSLQSRKAAISPAISGTRTLLQEVASGYKALPSRLLPITRHACQTLPSCLANSSKPTLARITFRSVVIVLALPSGTEDFNCIVRLKGID